MLVLVGIWAVALAFVLVARRDTSRKVGRALRVIGAGLAVVFLSLAVVGGDAVTEAIEDVFDVPSVGVLGADDAQTLIRAALALIGFQLLALRGIWMDVLAGTLAVVAVVAFVGFWDRTDKLVACAKDTVRTDDDEKPCAPPKEGVRAGTFTIKLDAKKVVAPGEAIAVGTPIALGLVVPERDADQKVTRRVTQRYVPRLAQGVEAGKPDVTVLLGATSGRRDAFFADLEAAERIYVYAR